MGKPLQRILFIKMRFYGDMLLTTPVISSLKRNYPDTKIDVLFYQDTTPVLSENPEINAPYGIENKKAKVSEKIANFFYLIKVLRANKRDFIANLIDQWIIAILVRLLDTRVEISQDYHHRQSTFWRNSFTHSVSLQSGNVVESNLSVLTLLGFESLVKQTTMSYPFVSQKRMRRELNHAGVGQNYTIIQPTAR